MNTDTIHYTLNEIRAHIKTVIASDSALGESLWRALLEIHPADIAHFITDLAHDDFHQLFMKLPRQLRSEVFEELSEGMMVRALQFMDEQEKIDSLNQLSADTLTDLFDLLSDEELRKYLDLLQKNAREEVLALLKFPPESAGGIMDPDVLTLMDDFTVERCIKIVQRLRPRREVHQQIYVTDRWHKLIGHIQLEDLLLHEPSKRITTFMQENEFIVQADEDQEEVAQRMVHYGLTIVPVVGKDNFFLGVISGETLVDVIVEEAGEDVQKMSAMAPMKHSYFETPFFKMLLKRSYILLALLLAESFSGTIVRAYEATMGVLLVSFIPMLISAGGNSSSQTSAILIRGLAIGDLHDANMRKFLRREFLIAFMLALILGVASFLRVYYTSNDLIQSIAVSGSLAAIVLTSIALGSCIPLLFKHFNIDPAFSAGPFLATLIDIMGVAIYCYITKLILF